MGRRTRGLGLILALLQSIASVQAATPAATLSISSGSALPGSSIALNVVLNTSNGALPSAVQWTINYTDSYVIGVTATTGQAAAAAGKSVQCVAGKTRGILNCIVFGLNQSVIAAGSLAVLSLQVAPNAPGITIPVGISVVVVSDPGGNPIQIQPEAAGGSIMVLPPNAVQVTKLEVFPPQLDYFVQPGLPVPGQGIYLAASDASARNLNILPSSSGWLSTAPGSITTPGQVAVNVTSPPSNIPLAGIVSLTPLSQGVTSTDVPVNLRSAGPTLYNIPRVVDGGGFATAITISNLDSSQAMVSLRFRRALADTTTISWTPNMEGNQTTESVAIPPNGSFTWRTRGLGNQVEAGWAQVVCSQKIGGFAIYRQSVAGRADQEVAVPVVSTWQQRFLLPFDNTNGLVTSMAITNASEIENGDVRAIFRDETGRVIQGDYRRVLPPLGHMAFATVEGLPFLRDRRGTAEFVMAGGRMSAVGLRFSASAFTSFEVQGLNTASSGRLIIPQIANAGGFLTTITLVNKDVVPAVVALRFYRRTNSDGTTVVWNPPMVNNQTTQNITIAQGSSVTWLTTGDGGAEQGWAEVVTSQKVSGFAVFLQRVPGRVDQEVAVPVNAGAQQRFLVPYDNTQPFTTTMALTNFADDTPALIAATIRDEQNLAIGQQILIGIPARGHHSFLLPERLPQSSGRRGTIEFQVQSGSVSALGLRFAAESFTSFKPQVIQ